MSVLSKNRKLHFNLAYYRHERIVQAIAEYGQALLLTKPDKVNKNRAKIYKQFVSMFDPNDAVNIVFKTDEIDHFQSYPIINFPKNISKCYTTSATNIFKIKE